MSRAAAAFIGGALAVLAGGVEVHAKVFVDVEPGERNLALAGTAPADEQLQRLVRIDHHVLDAARRGTAGASRLILNVAEGMALEAIVERSAPTSAGYSLSGRLASSPGGMTWVVNEGLVMGTIWTPLAVYDIAPLAGGIHAIRKVDPSAALPPGEPLAAKVDSGPDPAVAQASNDDGTSVDVLVLWTPAAEEAAGGEDRIRANIDYYVTLTNNALRSSGSTLEVRLASMEEVDYQEMAGESGTDLDRLRNPQDDHMDDIHARRDAVGADLVSLITDNTDVGGIAYRMDDLNVGFGAFAFSVVTHSNVLYFAGLAFAHELGHNMGLAHDRYVTSDNGAFHFGRGYVNAAAFRFGAADDACWYTIMAYSTRCVEEVGEGGRGVPYFSTPKLRYPDKDGELLGVPKTSDAEDVDGPADATLALELARLVVANFRAEHTDDGDTMDDATPVAGSSATFAQLDEDDVDYFRIALSRPGILRIESGGEIDTVGALLGAGGALLAENDDGGSGLNFLIEKALEPGTYFVEVRASGSATGTYALIVSFHADTDDDHGNTAASATTVTVDSTTAMTLDADDVDTFRFELRERGVLQTQTTGGVDTVGALSRDGDPFEFTFHQEQDRVPPHRGRYVGGGIVASETLSDDDSGPAGNFKIVGKVDPGTYQLAVRGWGGAQGAATLAVAFDSSPDDHGDSLQTATDLSSPALVPGERAVMLGELEAPMDLDYFRIVVPVAGTLGLGTHGGTDTWGTLIGADGSVLARNDDDPSSWPNFGIRALVPAGVYFLELTGWYFTQGPYTLEAFLEAGQRRTTSIPLFIADGHATQQGFIRILNLSDRPGGMVIHAIDDSGQRSEPLVLDIGAGQARHLNSNDLERGNPAKELFGAAGNGVGNWRLHLHADNIYIEALAYVRTSDGFLTSMHDVVPYTLHGNAYRHRVVTFNPARNVNQASELRLVNEGDSEAAITIAGIDDRGVAAPEGPVALTLPAGHSRTVTARDLEVGAPELDGRLGQGSGKWQLTVDADAPIAVMSLLRGRGGRELVNLSLPTSRTSIPLFMRADHPRQQGFLRVMNRSNEDGTVAIQAIDDLGVKPAPVELAIGARQVVHFNSDDLETGASAKGLSGGIGQPTGGNWRLELDTSLDIEAYSYVRTADGFLTSMHDLVRSFAGRHEVAIFNPASNQGQASRLRFINASTEDASVTIVATADDGNAGESELTLELPGGQVREITARQLEAGAEGLEGRLGDGAGKWRLVVTADREIAVMSLLEAKTGHLTNLSAWPAAIKVL